jgi:sugar lactone lactonase YvrE
MEMGLRHRLARAVALATLLLIALPGVAGAYTTDAGYAASDYATGFPASPTSHAGPIGVAFDQSDNLYVADSSDGNLYRFQPGGGVASSATRVTQSPISGQITGLVVSRSGDLYLARYGAGDVVQIDPGTGQVLRTVATVPCATGLAIDPASGDLFVSENQCGSTIWRVSGFASGPGTTTAYAHVRGVDGLAFDPGGTLYAEADGTIAKVNGTQSPTPGASAVVATVPRADGVAFGAPVAGQPPFLVANRNDGVVTRVDFNQGGASLSDIFSGGTRGDFVAVDSHGCLYVTQSASIVRIAGAAGSCAFEPSTLGASSAAPAPRVIATVLGARPHQACTLMRSLKFRLRQQGRVRLRAATIYLNGRRVKQLTGSAVTAPIVLSRLPSSSFTLKVIATTMSGKQLITTQFFANCQKPKPAACVNTSSLTVSVPQAHGRRVVAVEVYVNGHLTRVVHGPSITRVALKLLPRGRFTVKLVTRDARGRRATTSHSFLGCATSTKHSSR